MKTILLLSMLICACTRPVHHNIHHDICILSDSNKLSYMDIENDVYDIEVYDSIYHIDTSNKHLRFYICKSTGICYAVQNYIVFACMPMDSIKHEHIYMIGK